MSDLKSRITRLENNQPHTRPNWKDFISGAWIPSDSDWSAFLGGSEEYVKAQAWAESFTHEEYELIERIIEGDLADQALSAKLLNVPESLKPILDELEKVIENEQLTKSNTPT